MKSFQRQKQSESTIDSPTDSNIHSFSHRLSRQLAIQQAYRRLEGLPDSPTTLPPDDKRPGSLNLFRDIFSHHKQRSPTTPTFTPAASEYSPHAFQRLHEPDRPAVVAFPCDVPSEDECRFFLEHELRPDESPSGHQVSKMSDKSVKPSREAVPKHKPSVPVRPIPEKTVARTPSTRGVPSSLLAPTSSSAARAASLTSSSQSQHQSQHELKKKNKTEAFVSSSPSLRRNFATSCGSQATSRMNKNPQNPQKLPDEKWTQPRSAPQPPASAKSQGQSLPERRPVTRVPSSSSSSTRSPKSKTTTKRAVPPEMPSFSARVAHMREEKEQKQEKQEKQQQQQQQQKPLVQAQPKQSPMSDCSCRSSNSSFTEARVNAAVEEAIARATYNGQELMEWDIEVIKASFECGRWEHHMTAEEKQQQQEQERRLTAWPRVKDTATGEPACAAAFAPVAAAFSSSSSRPSSSAHKALTNSEFCLPPSRMVQKVDTRLDPETGVTIQMAQGRIQAYERREVDVPLTQPQTVEYVDWPESQYYFDRANFDKMQKPRKRQPPRAPAV